MGTGGRRLSWVTPGPARRPREPGGRSEEERELRAAGSRPPRRRRAPRPGRGRAFRRS